LTRGEPEAADYYPAFSPEFGLVHFLRLHSATSGDLYCQPLEGGEQVELLRHVTGSPGFYGNYYPAWVSLYFVSGTKGGIKCA